MHELQRTRVNEWTDGYAPPCNRLTVSARREFEEFTRAVAELFGPDQARLSAEDWLNEVALKGSLPAPRSHEWRLVTLAALTRLAIRMTVDLQYSSAARYLH